MQETTRHVVTQAGDGNYAPAGRQVGQQWGAAVIGTAAGIGAGKAVTGVKGKVAPVTDNHASVQWKKRVTHSGDNPTIQFDANNNQRYHSFRHVIKGGYDVTAVQNAVTSDLNKVGASLLQGQYTRTVVVNGVAFDYSAYKLSDGTTNVGRITLPKMK